ARQRVELFDETNLAVARGDFARALEHAQRFARIADTNGTEQDRLVATLHLIQIYAETGDSPLAAKVADAFLRRMGAWPEGHWIDEDPRPMLYAAAVRGGLRSPRERDIARDEWIAQWQTQLPPSERAHLWILGYAYPTETREEAETALAKLSEY